MNRLQERRLALGLSQPDVSAKLKEIDPRMDVGMVSRFERGACLPTPLVLEGLERILQATRSDLFGADELGVIHILEAPKEAPSPTTLMIQKAIPFGRLNAIKREALAKKLHMTDRKMREAIEQARSEGLIIICECNGRGYYQSNDLDEISYQYRQDTSRAMSILKRRKPMRDLLKDAGRSV